MNDKPWSKIGLIAVLLICIVVAGLIIIRSTSTPRPAEHAPEFTPPSKHSMKAPQ